MLDGRASDGGWCWVQGRRGMSEKVGGEKS